MRVRRIAVLGAGMAGLSAALLLARDGHRVTLVERDGLETGEALDAAGWERKGIPHFLQPHYFIPRGRAELKAHLPDVYADLIAGGASDFDLRRKLPGPVRADDVDLQYLALRRPLLEWALRRAVHHEPGIDCHPEVRVTGIDVARRRLRAVLCADRRFELDLAVDALGRRSPLGAWYAAAIGETEEPPETSDCGVVYYSRHYRLRPGFELPDGPWIMSPRGDLGYLAYASFPGDNRTVATVLAVPTGVADWRAFKGAGPFEAAVAQIPPLRTWIDPAGVEPITGVLPMAGLSNSIRPPDSAWPSGIVPVGDARCHTDPVLAHGLAFSLIHAAELARSLRDHDADGDAIGAFVAATEPALRERYEMSSALDAQRHRMWMGEPIDGRRDDGEYALFTSAARAALVDADVFRAFVRRIGLLDSTTVLDDDPELRLRIRRILAELDEAETPAPGPPRHEMVTIATGAAV